MMGRTVGVVALILCFVALSSAHVCMISPHQRGSENNINTPATPDCGLTAAPCGGRSASKPQIVLQAGSNFSVVFQKNENHFNPSNPGKFVLALAVDGTHYNTLTEVQDSATPHLTIYFADITLPYKGYHHAVLQVTYVTNMAGAGPFYQCADVSINKLQ